MQALLISAGLGHTDCERAVDGALAQPVLALTSVAYVAAGILVLFFQGRARTWLTWAVGLALVGVGVGSFAYHGPQPSWAGLAHDLPIAVLAAVWVAGLAITWRRHVRSAWVAPLLICALGLAAYVAGRSGSSLCRPDSLWQYHGAWHILSAAAALGVARAITTQGPKTA
ncbi:hypothetical protein [Mycobacterium deserti]|uniref:Ceramidase n=1 Tax=Mycobacterium deserti TaxID=2978347 RepID=A0ABT2MI02_9MYCO|nr:hypothetical protein [Mycobacterium deserti]MCT7661909.1 hypothetical protein [Mycobacterium deserti]